MGAKGGMLDNMPMGSMVQGGVGVAKRMVGMIVGNDKLTNSSLTGDDSTEDEEEKKAHEMYLKNRPAVYAELEATEFSACRLNCKIKSVLAAGAAAGIAGCVANKLAGGGGTNDIHNVGDPGALKWVAKMEAKGKGINLAHHNVASQGPLDEWTIGPFFTVMNRCTCQPLPKATRQPRALKKYWNQDGALPAEGGIFKQGYWRGYSFLADAPSTPSSRLHVVNAADDSVEDEDGEEQQCLEGLSPTERLCYWDEQLEKARSRLESSESPVDTY